MTLTMAGLLSGAIVAAGILFPAVPAQPAAAAALPTYARATDEATITGRISSVRGTTVVVRDDRGFLDHVELHRGTAINPTGLTLAAGMKVTVFGYDRGAQFAADEVDAPYRYAPAPPPDAYSDGSFGFGFGYDGPIRYFR
jgi:hypothetical protein